MGFTSYYVIVAAAAAAVTVTVDFFHLFALLSTVLVLRGTKSLKT